MVAASIRTLGRRGDLDCVVVIRGGGARNELATFDAEPIALAIATCPIPVLTGLGHEVDRSVADDVAHTALKTPTACAGHLIDAVHEYVTAAEERWAAITAVARQELAATTSALSDRAHRIARRTHAAVERADERLSTRVDRVRSAPHRRLDAAARRAADDHGRLRPHGAAPARRPRSASLDAAASRLALLDPVNLLQRGWSITRDADGRVVRSRADVAAGAVLLTERRGRYRDQPRRGHPRPPASPTDRRVRAT